MYHLMTKEQLLSHKQAKEQSLSDGLGGELYRAFLLDQLFQINWCLACY